MNNRISSGTGRMDTCLAQAKLEYSVSSSCEKAHKLNRSGDELQDTLATEGKVGRE